MIKRLHVDWPAKARPLARAVRLLAVSDERDQALDNERNRAQLLPLDAILGAGDAEPDHLVFLADAFKVPLLYVRGNHDRGGGWDAGRSLLPEPLDGQRADVGGISIAGMSWPGPTGGQAVHDDSAAWGQAVGLYVKWKQRRTAPAIIVSHVPPLSLGDAPEDYYHRGFAGYRWLCRALRPVLWIHGHTPVASTSDWKLMSGPTTLLNATGAVLVEIGPATEARQEAAVDEGDPVAAGSERAG